MPHPEEAPLPELHAGDEVSVLTEARLPQVFRDEGAFDRRAYLAQQGVDLVATLRSTELIEGVGPSLGTLATRLARTRKRLREEIDTLCGGSSQAAGVLRAMLLGDRSFADRAESTDFLAKTRKIPIEHELRGKAFDWDGVKEEFLWPENASDKIAAAAKNDDSLVLRLQYGERASCYRETQRSNQSARFLPEAPQKACAPTC